MVRVRSNEVRYNLAHITLPDEIDYHCHRDVEGHNQADHAEWKVLNTPVRNRVKKDTERPNYDYLELSHKEGSKGVHRKTTRLY